MPIRFTKAQKESLDIEEVCARCEFAVPLSTDEEVLCRKNGIVSAGFRCKKFRYDLLKRTPAARPMQEPLLTEPLPSLDDL
ncbi:MAG: hypothetical protein J6S76_05100 [Clostridia bacterium]|nr:hypothetical protein [Clostridia bacterium]